MRLYSPEEIERIFTTLPADLRETLFGFETAERVGSIAQKNDVPDTSLLSTIIGYVLVGLLHPNNLETTLENELKITRTTAQTVALEIKRFILSPVRENISKMYEFEFTPVAKPVEAPKETRRVAAPTEIPGQDTYREPVGE